MYKVIACAWQADSKGDVATMIALEGALKFNGGGAARRESFVCLCPASADSCCCAQAMSTTASSGPT